MDWRQAEVEALRNKLEWYGLFVEYVAKSDHDMYNKAYNYANKDN